MSRSRLRFALPALVAGLAASAAAVAGAATTPSSQPDISAPVADGPVYAIAHAPQGNTFIGGDFGHVGPRSGSGVALTDTNGTLDPFWTDNGNGLGTPGFPEVAGGEIKAVISDEHGGWYMGGSFTHVGSQPQARLAHIKAGGQLDPWNPNPNGTVRALALGKTPGWTLFVGGGFTSPGGGPNRLAAFEVTAATGAPTSAAPIGSWKPDPDGTIHALAAVTIPDIARIAGGTSSQTIVVVGGDYLDFAFTTVNEPDRLNGLWGPGATRKNGTSFDASDLSFGLAFSGAGNSVRALAAGPAVQGTGLTPSFNNNNNGNRVYMPIYVGGDFTSPSPKSNVAALGLEVVNKDSAAALAPTFRTFTNWTPIAASIGGTAPIRALALSGVSGGQQTLYIGGRFSVTVGNPAANSARRESLAAVKAIPLAPASVGDTGCVAGTAAGNCSALVDTNWSPVPGGPVWNPDSTIDPGNRGVLCVRTDAPPPCGAVNALAVVGNSVYAGGDFPTIGPQSPLPPPANNNTKPADQPKRNFVAELAPAGGTSTVRDWNPRLAGGPVNALAAYAGSIYAGGSFASLGAVPRDNLAAVDQAGNVVPGAGWDLGVEPCSGGGCGAPVQALALSHDASRLFVGGTFSQLGGAAISRLGAVDASSGVADTSFKPEPTSSVAPPWVAALDVVGNVLYVGGNFSQIASADRNRVAALDATSGSALSWNPDARGTLGDENRAVKAIAASCGGTVYVGGTFKRISGVDRPYLAEVEPVGTANAGQPTSWDPQVTSAEAVNALVSYGSTVYVGGNFSTIGQATHQNLAALDAGTGLAVSSWNPSADQTVQAVGLSADGQTLYAGGIFTNVGGADRAGLAALQAVGVGDGKGNAVAWDPSPAWPLPVLPANTYQGTYALAVWGDNVFAGGKFGQLGTQAQYGYGSFAPFADPAAVADACAPGAGGGTGQPTGGAPPPAEPAISGLRVTKRLAALFNLSAPSRVKLDLLRVRRGYELPVPRRVSRARVDRRATVCRGPSRATERRAKLYVRQRNRGRIKRMSAKERRRFIERRLDRLRCTHLRLAKELRVRGAQGGNRVPLAGPRGLRRGRYRLTALMLTDTGTRGAPKSVDFLVGRDGRKVTRGKG